MRALILAAGFGSRLVPITRDLPKALVPVQGRPILGYQLNALKRSGINEVVIVIGYQGDTIRQYALEEFPDMKFHFVLNREYDVTNSAYSFWLAKDYVKDDPYCHLNCDILFSGNLLSRLLRSEAGNAIAASADVVLGTDMEQVWIDQGHIVRMDNQPFPQATAKAFGLAKFSRASTDLLLSKIERYLQSGDRMRNYYGMIREAVAELDYHAVMSGSDVLLEINTLEDLARAEEHLRDGAKVL